MSRIHALGLQERYTYTRIHARTVYIHIACHAYIQGDFKDGKPHGTGVYTFRSGKKTMDQYRQGEEVRHAVSLNPGHLGLHSMTLLFVQHLL